MKILQDKRIVRMFKKGKPLLDIAEKLGLSKKLISLRIRDYLSRNGVHVELRIKKICRVCGRQKTLKTYLPAGQLRVLKLGTIKETIKHTCYNCRKN